jgi:ribosomal protein L15
LSPSIVVGDDGSTRASEEVGVGDGTDKDKPGGTGEVGNDAGDEDVCVGSTAARMGDEERYERGDAGAATSCDN